MLAGAIEEARLELDAPGLRRRRDARDEIGQHRLAPVEVRAQVRPFAHAHRLQLIDRAVERRVDGIGQRRADAGRLGHPFADAQRLRQAQQIARRQLALDDAVRARLVHRRRQRPRELDR